jgi:hypothetical protein
MKYIIHLSVVISLITLFPHTAHAETNVDISNNESSARTEVNVQTNTGQNTICRNGECTTTSNNGTTTSKVCVNGECFTGDNVDYKSEDGTTSVQINNSNTTNSTQNNTDSEVKALSDTATDFEAEINKQKEEIKKKVEDQKEKIQDQKQKLEEQKNIFQKLIDDLRDLFENLLSF